MNSNSNQKLFSSPQSFKTERIPKIRKDLDKFDSSIFIFPGVLKNVDERSTINNQNYKLDMKNQGQNSLRLLVFFCFLIFPKNLQAENDLGNHLTIEGLEEENSDIESNQSSKSPMIKWITKTLRPLIEVRLDYIIKKAGFDEKLSKTVDPINNLIIKIKSEGKDPAAKCSDFVTINLVVTNNTGRVALEEYRTKSIEIKLGENKFGKALDLGILGMKIGETRKIGAPRKLAKSVYLTASNLQDSNGVWYEVTLNSIRRDDSWTCKKDLAPIDFLSGITGKINCSDLIELNLTAYDTNGSKVYSTEQKNSLATRIGSGILPRTLEENLIGAHSGGKRLILTSKDELESSKTSNPLVLEFLQALKNENNILLELSPTLRD